MIRIRFRHITQLIFYAVVFVFLVIQVYPIFWVITSSIKQPLEAIKGNPFSLPKSLYFGNYINMLEMSQMPRYFLNSAIIALVALVGVVLFGAPAAYAIEKIPFRHNKNVLSIFLMGIMIPIFVTLLPMFNIYKGLNLRNTYWSLIIPQIGFGLPMCIYLYTGFMRHIPNSIIESAKQDGASSFRTFASIIFPMSSNTTMTILTLNFINVWNEFVFANTFMTSDTMKTIPIGLMDFDGQYGYKNWEVTFAAITLTILPILIVYFVLNKQVVEGMAAGAIKE